MKRATCFWCVGLLAAAGAAAAQAAMARADEQWFAPCQGVADYRPKGPSHCFRQFNLDWSWVGRRPEQLPELLSRADPAAYAEFLYQSHCDGVVVMAVPHHGYCTYATRVGTRFPGMQGDWFGRTIEELHRRRIAAFGYVTLNWNWKYLRANVGRDFIQGAPAADGLFPPAARICLNAPGYLELVESYTREVLEQYPVDGMRWDILHSAKGCTCPGCRQRFRELYGRELGRWSDWDERRQMDFYLATTRRVVERLHALCKRIKPGLEIWQNGLQSYADNDLTVGRQMDLAYNEYGDPFRLLLLRGVMNKAAAINGLMNESPAGAPLDRAAFRLCLALGGRCYSYHGHLHTDPRTALPDELITAWHRRQLAPCYAMVAQIEPWLIAARPVAPVAVVYCENTRYRFPHYDRASYVEPMERLTRAALARSMPLEFVNALDLAGGKGDWSNLPQRPGGCFAQIGPVPFSAPARRLLLLPGTSGLSAAELDALRQYAGRGGTLLLAGDVLRHDQQGREQPQFALAREMGLVYAGQSAAGGAATITGRLGESGPLSAATIKSFIRVRPEQGRTLLWLRQAGKEHPLLHVNELGRGRVAYLASLDSEALTLAAIRALAGPPPVEVQPPPCQVVLTEQAAEHRWVLHLISGGEYTVAVARSQVPAAKVSRQYPPAGWSYRLEPTPAGLRIHVGGQAQDRLLVLE